MSEHKNATTVDQGLLEEVPTARSAEAYSLPSPVQAPEVAQIEEEVALRVATVRDEQSLRIANMARDGAPHFLLHQDGQELCGSCGNPFPCPSWTGEIEPRNLAESSGQPVPNEDKARAVAELLQVPIEQARQIVLMSTPLDEIR